MKKLLPLCLLLITISAKSQHLSFEETVKFINDKIDCCSEMTQSFSANKNGMFTFINNWNGGKKIFISTHYFTEKSDDYKTKNLTNWIEVQSSNVTYFTRSTSDLINLEQLLLFKTKEDAKQVLNALKHLANLSTATDVKNEINAEIQTAKGNIVVKLDYKIAPITVANFILLVEGKNPFVTIEKLKGKPFYNGLKFHRVIKDFMIQGGDPVGDGMGNPGYQFKDRVTNLKFDKGGILAMASDPMTNGSQFFITHKQTPWLDGKHIIFGEVVSGIEVVNNMIQDDVINKITIIRKGDEANRFNALKVFSDYYSNTTDHKLVEDNTKSYGQHKDFKKIESTLQQNLVGKYFLGGLYDPPCYGIGKIQIADNGEIIITGEEKSCNVKFYIKDATIKIEDYKVKIYQANTKINITFYTENATVVFNELNELKKIVNN